MYQQRQRRDNRGRRRDTEFDSQMLDLSRVARMTVGGRRFRFRAAVLVGDRKGRIGVGLAKANDIPDAAERATERAKKRLIRVNIVNDTIPFSVEVKYKSARVLLRPAKQGNGLKAGGVVRAACELAGIKNITAKLLSKTNNKLNIARATLAAFKKMDRAKFFTSGGSNSTPTTAQPVAVVPPDNNAKIKDQNAK